MRNQESTYWLNQAKQELAIDRILKAARDAFERDGLRGARMGRIAELAGCSRATLYRYFPNKEALLQGYMTRVAEEVWVVIDARLRESRSLDWRLVEAVATSVEWIRAREELAPFFNAEGIGLTVELTAHLSPVYERMVLHLESESQSERIQGRLRPEISAEEAAEWLIFVILALSAFQAEGRSGAKLREYLQKMLVPTLAER